MRANKNIINNNVTKSLDFESDHIFILLQYYCKSNFN